MALSIMRRAWSRQTLGSFSVFAAPVNFSIHRLGPGMEYTEPAGDAERLVVVMSGRCHIATGRQIWHRVGRRHTVFFGVPYVAYAPVGSDLRVWTGDVPCELAVIGAPAHRPREPWLASADDIEAGSSGGENHQQIVVAAAGRNTECLTVGERLLSPGTIAPIPLGKSPRPTADDAQHAAGSGRAGAMSHIVHYRLFPTNSQAFQWEVSGAERAGAWTIQDGDSSALTSGEYAALAKPGTYVYYLWAASANAYRPVHTAGNSFATTDATAPSC